MSIKKLPDAEFEIMKAIWHSDEPITSSVLTEKLKCRIPEKAGKHQTVLTMLVRLEKKGFLKSEKNGKERNYYTAVSEEEYICIEAENFRKRFSGGKFRGLVKALYSNEKLSQDEIDELKEWINKI